MNDTYETQFHDKILNDETGKDMKCFQKKKESD